MDKAEFRDMKFKYDKEFRADHPETVGEIDTQFDTSNYVEWLEKKYGELLIEQNAPTLEDVKDQIKKNPKPEYRFYDVFVEDDMIIIENEYEMGEDEKNDDDCCDTAQEIGEMIEKDYPFLELHNYYCHRHKYAITEMKIKVPDENKA